MIGDRMVGKIVCVKQGDLRKKERAFILRNKETKNPLRRSQSVRSSGEADVMSVEQRNAGR